MEQRYRILQNKQINLGRRVGYVRMRLLSNAREEQLMRIEDFRAPTSTQVRSCH